MQCHYELRWQKYKKNTIVRKHYCHTSIITLFVWQLDEVPPPPPLKKKNPKNRDLSHKIDADLWDCLGKLKLVL